MQMIIVCWRDERGIIYSCREQEQMGEMLIREGTLFHSILQNKLKANEERTEQVKKFTTSIVQLLSNFSADITNACRTFFKKLKLDERQEENIIFLSKYIIDILHELGKKVVTIGKKIELDVMDPLRQFSDNQKGNHQHILMQSQELLYRLQHNHDLLKELRHNYHLNEGSHKAAEEKNLLRQIVESEMDKCGKQWQNIKEEYSSILAELNSLNSLRSHFTMKTQIEIVTLVNRLVNSPSVEESLAEYQDLLLENQTLTFEVKDEMRQQLGKLAIFQEVETTDLMVMAGEEPEKKVIDDFVGLFTNRSGLAEEEKSYQEARSLILENMRWANYFLSKLKSNLYTEIKLGGNKFRELASIIKYIFALVVQAQDNEAILYSLLFISYRVSCKDHYLIRELGKHDDFWKQASLWQSIVEYMQLLKLKGKYNQTRQPRKLRLKALFSGDSWGWGRVFLPKQPKNEQVLHQSKLYQILYQVNYYMAKLQLQQSFIFQFMTRQAAKLGLSSDSTRKLLEYHYLNKMSSTNKESSTYLARKVRLEEEYHKIQGVKEQKALVAVQKSLKYLPVGRDCLNLLLVCKYWAQHLRKGLFRRWLVEDQRYDFVARHRLPLYQTICSPPFNRAVYQRMVEQLPSNTEHLELIKLDARRSLGWDEKLRKQMVQVLNTFSFYHPDHGYLQGMNYLCENILKLTDDPYVVYFIFEHLMNNQYHALYSHHFHGLKIKIYQFMRLLERTQPLLYQHLSVEKIEGEHFVLPWAITLWGEMTGDLCWILWDGFLVEGWTWWFKVMLWLMRSLEGELMKMGFQQIMKCFSQLHSSLLSYSLKELGEYGMQGRSSIKQQIDEIVVQAEVLSQVQKEYKLRSSMINEYLSNHSKILPRK